MVLMNEAGLCGLTGDRAHVLAEYTGGDKAELTEHYQAMSIRSLKIEKILLIVIRSHWAKRRLSGKIIPSPPH